MIFMDIVLYNKNICLFLRILTIHTFRQILSRRAPGMLFEKRIEVGFIFKAAALGNLPHRELAGAEQVLGEIQPRERDEIPDAHAGVDAEIPVELIPADKKGFCQLLGSRTPAKGIL